MDKGLGQDIVSSSEGRTARMPNIVRRKHVLRGHDIRGNHLIMIEKIPLIDTGPTVETPVRTISGNKAAINIL